MNLQSTRPLIAICILLAGSNAHAGIIIHDTRFVAEQRRSGSPQTYPLAVDSSGAIYSVTGTASGADFICVNTDNSLTTLNNNIGRVVGVISDMEIGFGGDLYANFAQFPNSASGTHGVSRFDATTGAVSAFYTGASFNADGGLAFNATNSTLYMQSQLPNAPLLALDANGNASTIVSNLGEGRGLALESTGALLTIGQTEIRRVDPGTATVNSVRDIAADLPGYLLRSVDVLSTGEIAFTAQNDATQSRSLYSIAPTGGTLNLIATDTIGGPHQIKFGVSRDGMGESLYINNPDTLDLYELRFTAVPEPNSFVLFATGASILLFRRRKARN